MLQLVEGTLAIAKQATSHAIVLGCQDVVPGILWDIVPATAKSEFEIKFGATFVQLPVVISRIVHLEGRLSGGIGRRRAEGS